MRYLKVIGGKYPVLCLTPQGEAVIRNKLAIPLILPRQTSNQGIESEKARRQAGGTLQYTEQLLSEGLSVEQIAARRGLSPATIYSHAAKLIMAGRVTIEDVVSEDVREKIETAIRQAGTVEYLYPIKALLPNEIDYSVLRSVVVNTIAQATLPPGAAIEVTGNTPLNYEIGVQMTINFVLLVIAAILLMLIMMYLLWSKIRYWILPVVLLTFGLFYTFGIMGILGIPANDGAVAAFPILLGLGIDYVSSSIRGLMTNATFTTVRSRSQ